jgi:hypothetical protein
MWFAVALILADRHRLPAGLASRPLLGFTAGLVAMALRVRGFAVEGVFLTVAGLQMTVSAVEALSWTTANRKALWLSLRRAPLALPGRLKPAAAAGKRPLNLVVAGTKAPLQPPVAAPKAPLQPTGPATKAPRRRVGALQPK